MLASASWMLDAAVTKLSGLPARIAAAIIRNRGECRSTGRESHVFIAGRQESLTLSGAWKEEE